MKPETGMHVTAVIPTERVMADFEIYLEKLRLFSSLLRAEGIQIGPNETADACRILLMLGFEDRDIVKTALRTVFAKSRRDQLCFDRVFDSFFLSEEMLRAIDQKRLESNMARTEAIEQANRELAGTNLESLFYSEAQKEAYSQLSEEEKQRLRRVRDRFLGDEIRNPDLYANMIHSIFARSIMEQQMLMEDAALGRASVDPEMGMIYRDISEFEDSDIPKAVLYIQQLAARINGELTRKRKRSGKTGMIDFRRTIRKGLETGGMLFRISYRRKRQRRRQFVILCDVSGSMIRFSEFVLRFIQLLTEAVSNTRVFLFSEEMMEADAFQLQNMDRFREYVRESGVYGRGTHLGRALEKINDQKPPVLSSGSTLLIISDAKTVEQDHAVREVLRARAKAGRVFWLNPIPQRKWKYLKSSQTMEEICTMISCSTLSELGSACRRLAAGASGQ